MSKTENRTNGLKTGDEFRCPACGRDSVAVVEPRFEGWKRVGEDLVCGLCHAALKAAAVNEPVPDRRELDVLRAKELLGLSRDKDGGRKAADVLSSGAPDRDRHFCRDCRHYLLHPFLSRCILHDRAVEPMQDCPDFSARSAQDADSGSEFRKLL
ncbi:MAG: hypothetical protein GXP31_09460 [Kiritimatiellaeota bacterium]|nr:hypothetical protein [Kiritimatiellota bacterium]